MNDRWYKLYCDSCGWKKDVQEDFFPQMKEAKFQPLQGRIPKWDEEKRKTVTFPSVPRTRQFKCPKCGRLVRPRRMKDVQGELDERLEFEARSKRTNDKDWAERDQDSVEGRAIQADPPLRDEDGPDEVPTEPDVQL